MQMREEQFKGDLGVIAVQKLFTKARLVIQLIESKNDYGFDAVVWPTVGKQVKGYQFALQIKSGKSYQGRKGYFIPVDYKHARIWSESNVPVIGIVHDPDTDKLYWVNISDYLASREVVPSKIPTLNELTEDEIRTSFLYSVEQTSFRILSTSIDYVAPSFPNLSALLLIALSLVSTLVIGGAAPIFYNQFLSVGQNNYFVSAAVPVGLLFSSLVTAIAGDFRLAIITNKRLAFTCLAFLLSSMTSVIITLLILYFGTNIGKYASTDPIKFAITAFIMVVFLKIVQVVFLRVSPESTKGIISRVVPARLLISMIAITLAAIAYSESHLFSTFQAISNLLGSSTTLISGMHGATRGFSRLFLQPIVVASNTAICNTFILQIILGRAFPYRKTL